MVEIFRVTHDALYLEEHVLGHNIKYDSKLDEVTLRGTYHAIKLCRNDVDQINQVIREKGKGR